MWFSRSRNYVVAAAVLWALTYFIITGRVMTDNLPHHGDMAVRRLVLVTCGFLMCLGIGRVLDPLAGAPMWKRLSASLALSAAGAIAYVMLNHAVFYWIFPRSPEEPMRLVSLAMLSSLFVWSFLAWCALYFAIRYEEDSKAKDMRLLAAQALAVDAQNRMLRYQINPHFLFNTLNALSSLILAGQNDRAERVVLSLSQFLRHTLERELPDKSTLAEEIAAQREYLCIEEARFEHRLNYRVDVPVELQSLLAPSLILQPLIENAVKYGVARSREPVTIEIKAIALADRLRLSVRDDGRGELDCPPAKLGLGLENVRARLSLIYGERATLSCGPLVPYGFEAAIELPVERG